MNHALLKSVIYDQHEFIRDFQIVPRNYEFEENGNYVLVGLRRAGKSTLLYKIVLDLVASGVDWEQIIYINFEDERLSELGVRKTYGATNMRLIGQVLWENLLLTCIGGLLGLLISYLIVLTASDWILTLFDSYTDVEKTPFLSFEMLFNPTVFCASFGLCVLLNLISALIPAIWALRRNIIQSLNSKR